MKKTGLSLIILFTGLLICLIVFGDSFTKGLFTISVVSIASLIPFGASLMAINSSAKKRSQVKKIYLIISLFLIGTGLLSRFLHLPGAGIEIIIGVLWYCFAYSPLELKNKFIKWKPFSNSKYDTVLLSIIDFIGINFLALGILFKIQSWPGASYMMNIGLFTIAIGVFFWNSKFKKEVVLRKKSEDRVKEKNKEILDSITYAKRIQSAILPQTKIVKQFLVDSFILYKPKDIVAGDFYWLEVVDDTILFAAADCTGHGVPGAMVSVVCNNSLNRAVREFGLFYPNEILDKTRELVIQEFEKSDDDVKDGMDISLCALNLKTKELKWSGANNPLWIIRNNEILEFKADKQPIGKHTDSKPFKLQEIPLLENDIIYIFTDGFQDQFGGDRQKKFRISQMREMFLSLVKYSLEEQRGKIESTFETWKGSEEQVDDVCIIGVRI